MLTNVMPAKVVRLHEPHQGRKGLLVWHLEAIGRGSGDRQGPISIARHVTRRPAVWHYLRSAAEVLLRTAYPDSNRTPGHIASML